MTLFYSGGVRSFLLLKTLQLIENEFEGRLSTQHLFDLVVGTGSSNLYTSNRCKEG